MTEQFSEDIAATAYYTAAWDAFESERSSHASRFAWDICPEELLRTALRKSSNGAEY